MFLSETLRFRLEIGTDILKHQWLWFSFFVMYARTVFLKDSPEMVTAQQNTATPPYRGLLSTIKDKSRNLLKRTNSMYWMFQLFKNCIIALKRLD